MLSRPARLRLQPCLRLRSLPSSITHTSNSQLSRTIPRTRTFITSSNRATTASNSASAQSQSSSGTAGQVIHPSPHPPLDGSFHQLLKETDMGMNVGGRRKPASPPRLPGGTASTPIQAQAEGEGEEETDWAALGLEIDEPPISSSRNTARARSPSGSGSGSGGQYGLSTSSPGENGDREGGKMPFESREERRSPATVLGSKRIGVVVLPAELKDGIQREIDQLENPRQLRESYLSLPRSVPAGKAQGRDTKIDHRSTSGKPRRTFESELAKAAGVLPGEYGVVRNILDEMDKRLGSGWLRQNNRGQKNNEDVGELSKNGDGKVEVVEFSGGLGAGMWAMADAVGALPSAPTIEQSANPIKIQLVHSSRHGLDLAQKIAEDIPDQAVEIQFNRKHVPSSQPPALVLSTFNLSNLPTQPSQQSHLLHLLSLESPYLVLIDRRTPAGWGAISRVRQFILDQSTPEVPLHIVAPCPHDGVCPLAGTRDTCSFSQRIQRPVFTRKTKHSGRGEEDTGYCYVVIARGERPGSATTSSSEASRSVSGLPISDVGRVGGVGREEAERARMKREGRSILREIEGHEGVLEVVSLPNSSEDVPHAPLQSFSDLGDEAGKRNVEERLQEEAYTWPRLVAPPMKRSGHVTMDACCPDGNIQRLTFSKSHSKQGYHDARKSSWGDLFPHVPKATPVVRTRGVRYLNKPEQDDEGVLEEIMAGNVEEIEEVDEMEDREMQETLRELKELGINIPRAEVVEDGEGDTAQERSSSGATVWKTAGDGPFGKGGQNRGFTSFTGAGAGARHVSRVGLSPSIHLQSRSMSARPVSRSGLASRPKVTLSSLYRLSAAKIPISVITAYDYPTALLAESCGVDMLLVGDSLSQVALGHDSTTQITLDEMIQHSKSVAKGAKSPFIFADMPFGSFEMSIESGVANVIRLIKETGIDGVKIEGGQENLALVKRLSEIGIPVMAHIGLQPQRATSLSGYLVQGRTAETAYEIYETARKMQDAGAFGLLIEAVPRNVARRITEELDILTIGIGAGNATDGQVLVLTDILGVYAEDPVEGEAQGKESRELEPATQLALEDVKLPAAASSPPASAADVSAVGESAAPSQLPPSVDAAPLPTATATTSLLSPSSTSSSILAPTETSSSSSPSPSTSMVTPPLQPTKSTHAPRFVRQFGSIGHYARQAVRAYVDAVKSGTFPDNSESYGMKKVEWEGFLRLLEERKSME